MTYHYEFFVYTGNLCHGKRLLGRGRSQRQAIENSGTGSVGCIRIEKHRVYDAS